MANEAREDDGAEVAAAVGRQGFFTARIRRRDLLAVAQVVVVVDVVQEEDAGLGEVVGRAHDGVPQRAGGQGLVDPLAVGALVGTLLQQGGAGAGAVHQVPGLVFGHGLHEVVADADRDVEVVPAARRALGGDEFEHVGVVDAQHAHLGAAPRARAFHGGAGLVEDVDVAARARGQRGGGAHLGAAGADAREVVAHAAAAAHGFGGFAQGFVDAGVAAVVHALDAIAHGLHEAVDQRGLQVGAGRAHDAPRAYGAGLQVGQEQGLAFGAARFGLDRGQGAGHAGVELAHAGLAVLEVFLAQHIEADGLQIRRVLRAAQVFAMHWHGSRVDLPAAVPGTCSGLSRQALVHHAPRRAGTARCRCAELEMPQQSGRSGHRRHGLRRLR